jgi:transporter family protein
MNYLVFVLAAMCMWGLWGFLPRIAVSRLDSTSAQLFTWLGGTILAIPSVLIFRDKILAVANVEDGSGGFNHYLPYACAMGAGVCGMVGGFMYNKALSQCGENTATVIGISALYPVISILLTVIFLKQKLNLGQIAGVVVCISGALLLAYSSNTTKVETEPQAKPVEQQVDTAV